MVHTWIMDVTPLQNDMIYRRCYNRLPDWRREKADRIRPLEGKMQSAGAWILYQQMRKYYELSDQMPYNLSHSGKYALCSVSTQPDAQVGCDVEMIKENKQRLAERYFCPGEVDWIQSQTTEAEQAEGFYRYWVLKESFIKAIRLGMKQDLCEFEIALDEPEARLVRQPDAFPEKYYYQEYRTDAGDARIAVCSTEKKFGELHYLDERNII